MKYLAVTPFDQQALDPAPTQIGREREADGPTADNENRHVAGANIRCVCHRPRVSLMREFCQLTVGAWLPMCAYLNFNGIKFSNDLRCPQARPKENN